MRKRYHLSVLVHEQAKRLGSKPVLTFRKFGDLKWRSVSWNQFSLRVKQVSNALLNFGLKPQEGIGVFAQNCIQSLYTDFGAYGIRVFTTPFYATSSEQQLQYMINDSGVRLLFVGEQEQYDRAHRIFAFCPKLERVIVYDHSVRISSHDPNAIYFEDFIAMGESLPRQSEVEQRWAAANHEDICNILYTSGTTGEGKGVVLTYKQYDAAMEANLKCVPVTSKDKVMCFLPFTHVFERAWSYLCLTAGAQLIVNTYPKEVQQSMRETHPTCMAVVPRFWEKIYIGVHQKIEQSGAIQRRLFTKALEIARRYHVDYLSKGKRPPLGLTLEYQMYDKTIISLVRKQLGLTNPNFFPTAGAYVSPEIEAFVHSLGLCALVGYGLTESTATVSCDFKGKPFTVGSVGRPIEGIEIKIGENDEILLKGPTITPGYFKREDANQTAFDDEGFFHTGDAGYLKDGELFLTERIKDLYKTSNGKYIAPQMVESMLLVDKYIEQAVVIAEQRKFVSALIVPEFVLLEQYAADHEIQYANREELCTAPQIIEMMKERVETLQQTLTSYEKIKRFTLIPHHFSMERGEMTNTLKIRRNAIAKNYKDEIERMYAE